MNTPWALQLDSAWRKAAVHPEAAIRRKADLGYSGVVLAGTSNWATAQREQLLAETPRCPVGTHGGLPALEHEWDK